MNRASALSVAALALLAAGCASRRLEARLKPPDADFLSKVRYIITADERKAFLATPDEGKAAFQDEFWKKRDPDPSTPGNDYKDQYLSRVAASDRMFHGEGRPGFMTDRGRIYVLFGPPMNRMTYTQSEANGHCREVWYYGAFPVVFEDAYCEGHYVLISTDLYQLQEINKEQGRAIREGGPRPPEAAAFDFEARVEPAAASPAGASGVVVVEVPYEALWMSFRGGRFATSVDVRLELRGAAGPALWSGGKTFALDLSREELDQTRGRSYRMEVPYSLDAAVMEHRGEAVAFHIRVRNGADREAPEKTIGFRLAL